MHSDPTRALSPAVLVRRTAHGVRHMDPPHLIGRGVVLGASLIGALVCATRGDAWSTLVAALAVGICLTLTALELYTATILCDYAPDDTQQ